MFRYCKGKATWVYMFKPLIFAILGILSIQGSTAHKANPAARFPAIEPCPQLHKNLISRLEMSIKKRRGQAYYENFYQQTENFLDSPYKGASPIDQSAQGSNFLPFIQSRVGGPSPSLLAPLPSSPYVQKGGSLASPILETTRRPMREERRRSIRYIYEDEVKGVKALSHEEDDNFQLIPSFTGTSTKPKQGKPFPSEEDAKW